MADESLIFSLRRKMVAFFLWMYSSLPRLNPPTPAPIHIPWQTAGSSSFNVDLERAEQLRSSRTENVAGSGIANPTMGPFAMSGFRRTEVPCTVHSADDGLPVNGSSVNASDTLSLMERAIQRGLSVGRPSDNQSYERPVMKASFYDDTETHHPLSLPPGRFRSHNAVDKQHGLIPKYILQAGQWTDHTTPDGQPYFSHTEMQIVTDTYIRHQNLFDDVQEWAEILHGLIEAQRSLQPRGVSWPRKWEAYISVESSEMCSYYIVDHDIGQVFWLQAFDDFLDTFELEHGETVPASRVDLYLQSEYWTHVQMFPHMEPRSDTIENLRRILTYAHMDTTISPGSTAPFSTAQCASYLEDLKDYTPESTYNAIVARLMKIICESRILNRFGEEGARLDRGQVSNNPVDTPLSTFQYFCYSMFHMLVLGSDASHLARIYELTVDNYVPPDHWQTYISNLSKSTDQSNIVATVLFAGNIGFLAIGNLNTAQGTACIISTTFSLVSLVIGLHHVRQHSGLANTDAYLGVQYFEKVHTSWLGYRTLGLLHCLPWAFLMWSVITILVSIYLYAFQTVCTPSLSALVLSAVLAGLLLLIALKVLSEVWDPRAKYDRGSCPAHNAVRKVFTWMPRMKRVGGST